MTDVRMNCDALNTLSYIVRLIEQSKHKILINYEMKSKQPAGHLCQQTFLLDVQKKQQQKF